MFSVLVLAWLFLPIYIASGVSVGCCVHRGGEGLTPSRSSCRAWGCSCGLAGGDRAAACDQHCRLGAQIAPKPLAMSRVAPCPEEVDGDSPVMVYREPCASIAAVSACPEPNTSPGQPPGPVCCCASANTHTAPRGALGSSGNDPQNVPPSLTPCLSVGYDHAGIFAETFRRQKNSDIPGHSLLVHLHLHQNICK